MRCREFERRGAAALEAGGQDPEHLLRCRRCRGIEAGYRRVAARLQALPDRSGPLPTWQMRVRARISLERAGASRERTPWWRRAGVWIAAYAVVILLFAASALDAHRDRERMEAWEAEERLELVRRAEDALAPLELAAAQEDMAYQMIHVAHAWAHGNRRLARARERALSRLEARFESALRDARRARAH